MDDSQLELMLADALSASAFFTAPGVSVRIEVCAAETLRWEIFRGHLLDARQTREERTFRSWRLWIDDPNAPQGPPGDDANAPSVALRWDAAREELYVTRAILIRGWEVYESRPGFLESRPAARWSSELVGTIDFRAPWRRAASQDEHRRELAVVLAQAWTGVSRLPITSVEAPLPSFSLGRSGYDASLNLPPAATAEQLLCDAWRSPAAPGARWRLEMALRALQGPPCVEHIACSPDDSAQRAARAALVESLFHGISLSPFTEFTERVLQLLAAARDADQLSESQTVDLTSHMIRHLVRHLTAYDLVKFHSFGANYPDALWLDQLLRSLIQQVVRAPQRFLDAPDDDAANARAKRLRRRALRQGWLVRRMYEGHRVPDAPTSQGEHPRILPASFETAPEQQITEPGTRRRQLFADSPSRSLISPAAEAVWRAALEDLRDERELRELGAATFLDRPFGIFKPPGAVDRTPLLAYEACSRQIAQQRLADLRRFAGGDVASALWEDASSVLETLAIAGVSASDLPGVSRQGVIMLEDARQASPDFVIVRTTRGAWRQLAETPVIWNHEQRQRLREWAESPDAGLLLRAGNADQVRASGVWLQCRSADGRMLGEVCCAAASWGEYGEAWGVEFPRAELVTRRFRSSSLDS